MRVVSQPHCGGVTWKLELSGSAKSAEVFKTNREAFEPSFLLWPSKEPLGVDQFDVLSVRCFHTNLVQTDAKVLEFHFTQHATFG